MGQPLTREFGRVPEDGRCEGEEFQIWTRKSRLSVSWGGTRYNVPIELVEHLARVHDDDGDLEFEHRHQSRNSLRRNPACNQPPLVIGKHESSFIESAIGLDSCLRPVYRPVADLEILGPIDTQTLRILSTADMADFF